MTIHHSAAMSETPIVTEKTPRLLDVSDDKEYLSHAEAGKTVLLPEQAMEAQATLSWGGDAGRQIARLVLNDAALGETFNICSAEHHSWKEIAAYYADLIGLRYETVDKEIYLRCKAPEAN